MNPANIESILATITGLASSPEEKVRLEYRNAPAAGWDVKLISGNPDALDRAAKILRDSAVVDSLRIKGANAFIGFDDRYVEGQVERMLNGAAPVSLTSPFRGQRAIVQFIDPNTTKALHLGHLYEAILGNALAALLESLGAEVRRYCFVSDISRSVCEAMAGFEAFGDGKGPDQIGEKPDHMVGRLYAQYAARYYELHPEEADNEDPVRRETSLVGDRADELMGSYQAGDAGTRALWKTVRDWVLDGQLATLARLNVRLDTVQYGSDTDPDIGALVARGLAGNILEREPSGAIVFHSGKQEYRTVVISRPDGFPTEHTRQMAQMVSVFPLCRDLDRYYTFMGMEWKPAWVLYENILRGWGDNPYHGIVVPVCHGMVMVEGSKMKSSKGAVVLADEFLDAVETTRGGARARRAQRRSRCGGQRRRDRGQVVLPVAQDDQGSQFLLGSGGQPRRQSRMGDRLGLVRHA